MSYSAYALLLLLFTVAGSEIAGKKREGEGGKGSQAWRRARATGELNDREGKGATTVHWLVAMLVRYCTAARTRELVTSLSAVKKKKPRARSEPASQPRCIERDAVGGNGGISVDKKGGRGGDLVMSHSLSHHEPSWIVITLGGGDLDLSLTSSQKHIETLANWPLPPTSLNIQISRKKYNWVDSKFRTKTFLREIDVVFYTCAGPVLAWAEPFALVDLQPAVVALVA